MTDEEGRNRREDISQRPLDPQTLCGTWFHRLVNDEYVEQGLVVAEVQPGVYLVEYHDWATNRTLFSTVVPLERMVDTNDTSDTEWRFYDTEEAMHAAFVAATTQRRVEA